MSNPHRGLLRMGVSFEGRSKESYNPGTMNCTIHQATVTAPMISNGVIFAFLPCGQFIYHCGN